MNRIYPLPENSISTTLRKIVCDIRTQNIVFASRLLSEIFASVTTDTSLLSQLMEKYGKDVVMDNLSAISKSFETEDWILTADLLEQICIPAIESLTPPSFSTTIGNYTIEDTASGWVTVSCKSSNSYLLSTVDPMWEAELLAKDIYDPALPGYIVWGCGLGYFALKLGELTNGSVPIKIFEEDTDMIRLAKDYGCLSQMKQYDIEVIHDAQALSFTHALSKHPEYGLMIHLASVKKIENSTVRDILLDFYRTNQEPVKRFSSYLLRNYYSNVSLETIPIETIENSIHGNDVVIVAAGPSLDESFGYLRDCNKKTVIAVGTVLRKLINQSIFPDYSVFLDPYETTYQQIDGLIDCQIPMILGMSTYWRIGKNYKGPKLLALTKGLPEFRRAYENSKYVFDARTSVITLAIDIAMQMGASAIYLIGADMAYKDGMSHASNTHEMKYTPENTLIPVKGVAGDTVYTTLLLNEMREWIEGEIIRYPKTTVYNLSKTGALIKGTKPLQ